MITCLSLQFGWNNKQELLLYSTSPSFPSMSDKNNTMKNHTKRSTRKNKRVTSRQRSIRLLVRPSRESIPDPVGYWAPAQDRERRRRLESPLLFVPEYNTKKCSTKTIPSTQNSSTWPRIQSYESLSRSGVCSREIRGVRKCSTNITFCVGHDLIKDERCLGHRMHGPKNSAMFYHIA